MYICIFVKFKHTHFPYSKNMKKNKLNQTENSYSKVELKKIFVQKKLVDEITLL
jgi:hypothetical protein